MMTPPTVKKTGGETEEFSEEKVRDSLQRAGASSAITEKTVKHLEQALDPTTTTNQIYFKALQYLQAENPKVAAAYSLKRAIMELGPTGYTFEKYIGRILEEHGFEVYVGRILKGDCVDHEVDVTAKRHDMHIMVEAKYHNRPGIRTNLKVAMYTYARFLDVKKDFVEGSTHPEIPHIPWLVTNTQVTTSAIQYAECKNMQIVAWRYPKNKGLEYYIESQKLYPITVLSCSRSMDLRRMGDHGLVLAKDIGERSVQELQKICQISHEQAKKVKQEVEQLLYG